MTVLVALLRGVNVGGRNRLAMADLRAAAEECGFSAVRTYVQSGNLVFRATGAVADVATNLRSAIAAATSVDPAIAMRTSEQLGTVIDGCPFQDTAAVHVAFQVEGAPRQAAIATLDAAAFAPEQFAVRGRETYLYLPDGLGRSKLAQALTRGRAAEQATMRNWRTVTKLASMADEAASM
ncbi:MAG: DUF1697 domain-containing protein [Actinomycetota bacterium]|nr:DUF1697 domain-containing protein [Actinomycetota bacterium]